MPIFTLFILNKNAGMIYSRDLASAVVKHEFERSYSYPLEVKLEKSGAVKFGARDPIKIGHSLLSVNGQAAYLDKNDSNRLKFEGDMKGYADVHEFLADAANYPCTLKFGKQPLKTNDKLVLTGRFFGLDMKVYAAFKFEVYIFLSS